MNWYQIFYWVTVADGVKGFFDVVSTILLVLTLISFGFYVGNRWTRAADTKPFESMQADKDDRKAYDIWAKHFFRFFWWSLILCIVTWSLYVFCPSKKDALIIIAGGAVGNFITSDSSARQIPAELTLLVREKLKSEIEDVKSETVKQITDTLSNKSKEELIKIIRQK